MDLLSSLPISPVFILLLGVVSLLFIFEIVYLIKRKSQKNPQEIHTNPSSSSSVILTPQAPQKNSFLPWVAVGFTLVLIIGIATLGYFMSMQERQTLESEAYVTGESAQVCHVKLGPPKGEVINGNKYSITVPLENMRTKPNQENKSSEIQLNLRGYTCSFIDKDVCSLVNGGDERKVDFPTYTMQPDEVKDITFEMTQEQGECGTVQIDTFIWSVDGDTSCNTKGETVAGLHKYSRACGEVSPTPTTQVTPTFTPTPTLPNIPSNTPTITPPGATNTPIPGACINLKLYLVSDGNFFSKELTISDLQALSPGTKVNVTVLGDTQTSSAELSINDSQWKPLPQMRLLPNTALKEYYDSANLFDIANYPNKASFVFLGQVD